MPQYFRENEIMKDFKLKMKNSEFSNHLKNKSDLYVLQTFWYLIKRLPQYEQYLTLKLPKLVIFNENLGENRTVTRRIPLFPFQILI